MPNRNYRRSADRERALKLQGEREGWFATRTPASKGIADVVWLKPDLSCSHPDHFRVKLFQIKVSEHFKEPIELVKAADTPAGWPATVIWRCYPVRKKKHVKETLKGGE